MAFLTDLINMTEGTEKFPVRVNDIRAFFIDNGVQEEINLLEVDMDKDVCAAIFERRTDVAPPYSTSPRVANILISNQLNECWRRLIACKELIHLTDTDGHRAKTRQQIKTLIDDVLGLPNNQRDPQDMCKEAQADWMAFNSALFLLAPVIAIDKMRDSYYAGKIDQMDIALFFKIPEVFVPLIMSEEYAEFYTKAKFELVSSSCAAS